MWIVAPRGHQPRLTNTSVFNMHQDAGIVDAVNFVEDGNLAFKAIYVIRLGQQLRNVLSMKDIILKSRII